MIDAVTFSVDHIRKMNLRAYKYLMEALTMLS
jgi:hypothetical protein